MASDGTRSAASDKSAMTFCLTGALFVLLPAPAHAEPDALQWPAMIAAAAGDPSDQVRINQLKQELKTVQQLLKQKNITAEQREIFESRRKTVQAELDDLVPKTKKPQTNKKAQTAKGEG